MGKNTFIKFSILIIISVLCVSVLCVSFTNHYNMHDKFSVINYDGSQLLNEFLVKSANNQFENRRKEVSKALENTEEVKNYIENIRNDYLDLFTVNSGHGYHKGLREACVCCFSYRFKGKTVLI